MRWFWEHSHYRKITGDLVLDRVFGTTAPERPLPADFGVRLTAANIDAHIARAGTGLRAWAAANSDLVSPIVRAAPNLAQPPGRGDLLVGRNSTYRRSAVAHGQIAGFRACEGMRGPALTLMGPLDMVRRPICTPKPAIRMR